MALKQRLMTAIYLRYEDQWLLLKRQGSRVVEDGLYTGTAGGHFEENEMGDPFACVQRELNEETGLTESDLKGLKLRYICMRKKEDEIRVNHYFFAELKILPEEICSNEGELKWIPEQELSQLPMPYSARQAINHYLALGRQTEDLYVGVKTDEGMEFLPIVS